MLSISSRLAVALLALAATVLSQQQGLCRSRGEERRKVVIVGAGVSGFAAAATLIAHNFTDFVVLEASDRIGGRIHTVEFGGVPVDKGAEVVHGEKDNVVYDLVSPHNILASYTPLMVADKHLYVDVTGRQYNKTLVHSLADQARNILSEEYGDYNGSDGSVAGFFYPKLKEFLTESEVDPELGEAITQLVANMETVYSAADNLGQLGARGEGDYIENDGDRTLKWTSRGYKTIFEIMSKKFPYPSEEQSVMDKIQFGKEVQRVEEVEIDGDGPSEVLVKCKDGSSYRADHVILTVSLGVLKKQAAEMFHPPLPQNKTDVIRTMGIGSVGKVFLLFPTRWWPKEVNVIIPLFSNKQLEDFKKNSSHGYWTGYTTGLWPVMQHDRMFCAWFAGDACRTMEKLTEEEVIDGQMELLNALVGKQFQIPRPGGILRTNWASNPYTLGAYSFHTPDSDRLNITRQHLSEPLLSFNKPVVMFAGEATHPHYWGTVHGGLTTGVREAKNLLHYLRTHAKPI